MHFKSPRYPIFKHLALLLIPGLLFAWFYQGRLTWPILLVFALLLALAVLHWLFGPTHLELTAEGFVNPHRPKDAPLPYQDAIVVVTSYQTKKGAESDVCVHFVVPEERVVSLFGVLHLPFIREVYAQTTIGNSEDLVKFMSALIGYDPTIESRVHGLSYAGFKGPKPQSAPLSVEPETTQD